VRDYGDRDSRQLAAEAGDERTEGPFPHDGIQVAAEEDGWRSGNHQSVSRTVK